MKRRSFVKTSLVGGSLAAFSSAVMASNNKSSKQEFYELRVYTCKTPEQINTIEEHFEKAAIPAYNRIGSKTIGVFKELKPGEQPKLYVLIPFESLDKFMESDEKLHRDAVYNAAGTAYLTATAASPAYDRIESSLLHSFVHMPAIAVPARTARIFELRRYESPTEAAGKKKIEMFNDKGEIEIFKRTGLAPVFFGETIIGGLRPNLTYMLTYPDMDAHDKGWKTFGNDPEWKTIKAIPEFADAAIISHITSTFLTPAPCSQI